MGDLGTGHMDEDEVETYSLGGFSERGAAPYDEHLLICDLCRANVEATDAYLAAMRGAMRQIRQTARQAKPESRPRAKTRAAGCG